MEEKREIKPALKRMECGDMVVFPLTRTNNVRATISLMHLEWPGRRYTTAINRDKNRLEVTRTV